MRIAFDNTGRREVVHMDDVRIVYRNFEGRAQQYNNPGDRNFSVIIPTQEIADALMEHGYRVRIKPPREEGDMPFMHLPVKVRFNDRGPTMYLESCGNRRELDEESIGILDNIDIAAMDIDISPYDWTNRSGESGRSAYLQGGYVVQDVNRFAKRFAEEEYPEEDM